MDFDKKYICKIFLKVENKSEMYFFTRIVIK